MELMKTLEDQGDAHKASVGPLSEEWAEAWKKFEERVRQRPGLHVSIALAVGYLLQIVPLRNLLVLAVKLCLKSALSVLLFQAGGDMAARMAAKEWAETPLGLPSSWPQSLRAIVRVMLTSRYAMWMAWGPDLTFFCNDAYLPTLGVKESWALGTSARKVWEEIWPDIGPRIGRVLATGEATWDEALLLFLERSGYPEETYHTFS